MKTTLVCKLLPTRKQAKSLLAVIERYNRACDAVAGVASHMRITKRSKLRELFFWDVREGYGLPARMALHAIDSVAKALRHDPSAKPCFLLYGAVPYDHRTLSWRGRDRVSIQTLYERLLIPVVFRGNDEAWSKLMRGPVHLVCSDYDEFYLIGETDVPDPPTADSHGASESRGRS